MSERANRLAAETSPYLLQHANNPVDWYPWGPEALARAKRQDRPILLSVGYAACHWCHVMERESFEDPAIAALMNEHFVCVKVDREERPDLDEIYMAATVAMTGQGGWPMTVFLTPDQRPFFAGTYFPPEDRYGRPGFGTLLTRVAEVWQRDREGLEDQAERLSEAVRAQLGTLAPGPVDSEAALARLLTELRSSYDSRWGGFGGAPKFPPAALLRLLLRLHARRGDAEALQMALGTLDGMKNGGMYDHLGGGFARYATDERWHVPHFEKMLYDNAQLAQAYLEAYQLTKDPAYRQVATETLDYLCREMQSPEGGFYSATDADSEGVEGKFFTFTPAQVRAVLGEPAASQLCAYYDIRTPGNWEGTNVLWTPRPLEAAAEELGIAPEALAATVRAGRAKLYEARTQRVPPLLDDKVLVSWNGLAIGALAEGAHVLGEARYRQAAERAADDLLTRLRRPDGGLFRTARAGKAHLDGYLEDYAYLSEGLLTLYESGAARRYLDEAARLCRRMCDDFYDAQEGAFYLTARGHEQLLARSRDGQDGATPSPAAVAARVCARLAYLLDDRPLRDVAQRAVEAFGAALDRAPRAFISALTTAELLRHGPVELALVGAPDDPTVQALRRGLAEHFVPDRVLAHGEGGDGAQVLPLLRGRAGRRAALYVCRDGRCLAPVFEPAQIPAALAAAAPPQPGQSRRL